MAPTQGTCCSGNVSSCEPQGEPASVALSQHTCPGASMERARLGSLRMDLCLAAVGLLQENKPNSEGRREQKNSGG